MTVWYITSASGFMGWFVALLTKDCRYFCCYSKINLMKGKFLSFRHSEVCEIRAFVFVVVIPFPFLFKSFFFYGGYGISLKIFWVLTAFIWFIYSKHTWNWMVKSDSMKWDRGIQRKIKSFWYWMTSFTCWLDRAGIMTR